MVESPAEDLILIGNREEMNTESFDVTTAESSDSISDGKSDTKQDNSSPLIESSDNNQGQIVEFQSAGDASMIINFDAITSNDVQSIAENVSDYSTPAQQNAPNLELLMRPPEKRYLNKTDDNEEELDVDKTLDEVNFNSFSSSLAKMDLCKDCNYQSGSDFVANVSGIGLLNESCMCVECSISELFAQCDDTADVSVIDEIDILDNNSCTEQAPIENKPVKKLYGDSHSCMCTADHASSETRRVEIESNLANDSEKEFNFPDENNDLPYSESLKDADTVSHQASDFEEQCLPETSSPKNGVSETSASNRDEPLSPYPSDEDREEIEDESPRESEEEDYDQPSSGERSPTPAHSQHSDDVENNNAADEIDYGPDMDEQNRLWVLLTAHTPPWDCEDEKIFDPKNFPDRRNKTLKEKQEMDYDRRRSLLEKEAAAKAEAEKKIFTCDKNKPREEFIIDSSDQSSNDSASDISDFEDFPENINCNDTIKFSNEDNEKNNIASCSKDTCENSSKNCSLCYSEMQELNRKGMVDDSQLSEAVLTSHKLTPINNSNIKMQPSDDNTNTTGGELKDKHDSKIINLENYISAFSAAETKTVTNDNIQEVYEEIGDDYDGEEKLRLEALKLEIEKNLAENSIETIMEFSCVEDMTKFINDIKDSTFDWERCPSNQNLIMESFQSPNFMEASEDDAAQDQTSDINISNLCSQNNNDTSINLPLVNDVSNDNKSTLNSIIKDNFNNDSHNDSNVMVSELDDLKEETHENLNASALGSDYTIENFVEGMRKLPFEEFASQEFKDIMNKTPCLTETVEKIKQQNALKGVYFNLETEEISIPNQKQTPLPSEENCCKASVDKYQLDYKEWYHDLLERSSFDVNNDIDETESSLEGTPRQESTDILASGESSCRCCEQIEFEKRLGEYHRKIDELGAQTKAAEIDVVHDSDNDSSTEDIEKTQP